MAASREQLCSAVCVRIWVSLVSKACCPSEIWAHTYRADAFGVGLRGCPCRIEKATAWGLATTVSARRLASASLSSRLELPSH
ncbi:hypothetical protein MAPG_04175 [Magnaporthiopsis poae ATCC 64411]|uniref:Uncharacterized protein n=1 Tax=Magnaporthiopsis poae (strain ATCC 64411 / 73-15) TaxID=644358 RepID=A0A0C4DW08_MAGP6|nr:hypothetical protein MAPG_04175 [Magnaporthiopsis poae ATCC 64411]